MLKHIFYGAAHHRIARREVGLGPIIAIGEPYAVDSLQATLKHHAHSARIYHIHTRIIAVIDARKYQVGPTRQQHIESQLCAVDRGAVHAYQLIAIGLLHHLGTQRRIHGQRR